MEDQGGTMKHDEEKHESSTQLASLVLHASYSLLLIYVLVAYLWRHRSGWMVRETHRATDSSSSSSSSSTPQQRQGRRRRRSSILKKPPGWEFPYVLMVFLHPLTPTSNKGEEADHLTEETKTESVTSSISTPEDASNHHHSHDDDDDSNNHKNIVWEFEPCPQDLQSRRENCQVILENIPRRMRESWREDACGRGTYDTDDYAEYIWKTLQQLAMGGLFASSGSYHHANRRPPQSSEMATGVRFVTDNLKPPSTKGQRKRSPDADTNNITEEEPDYFCGRPPVLEYVRKPAAPTCSSGGSSFVDDEPQDDCNDEDLYYFNTRDEYDDDSLDMWWEV